MREGRRGAAVPREARAEARRAPARAEAATGAVRNRAAASDMVDARVGSGRGESEKAHAADVSLRVVNRAQTQSDDCALIPRYLEEHKRSEDD